MGRLEAAYIPWEQYVTVDEYGQIMSEKKKYEEMLVYVCQEMEKDGTIKKYKKLKKWWKKHKKRNE